MSNKKPDLVTYMIASEKMSNFLQIAEHTIMFMDENSIKPDENVKNVLVPMLDKFHKWLKHG